MEILDLYDDKEVLLNKTIVRGTETKKGENIMLSVVFIKNELGEYLIQQTSKEKGGYYSSTGGHVIHNENGIKTIKRELKEELGIESDNIKYLKTFKYPLKNCLFNVYLLEVNNLNIDDLSVQKEEVSSVEFLNKEQILKLIKENKFLNSHAYIFENYII